jgi:hypothetical protein
VSGGSYDYAYSRIEELADRIRPDGSCSAAPPTLRKAFAEHLRTVAKACRAIEWNDSCDGDDNETALIVSVLGKGAEVAQALKDAKVACEALDAAIARAEVRP